MMALRMDIPICDRDCTNVAHADEIEGAMIVCFERSSVRQSCLFIHSHSDVTG
jgi:hypothetical protein